MNNRTKRAEDRSATIPGEERKRRAGRDGSGTDGVADSTLSSAFWEAVRSPIRLQLFEAVVTRPGVTARELAEALGTSPPRLHYHLNILRAAGLIRLAQEARSSEKGPAAVGFEAARADFLARAVDADAANGLMLSELLVQAAQAGFASAGERWHRRDGRGSRTLVRCGHEALTPSEVEAVWSHLKQIEAILQRARERRRRSKSIVAASCFVGVCLSGVVGSQLPDGQLALEAEDGIAAPATNDGAAVGRRGKGR